ncbi:MAG: hypothetical protein LBQ79_10580 [Deltaproteobacteria bacterium]|jgi:hypothetical protein|nr:hypothetical protein [Deltaproteobacteria bacterium]
MPKSSNGPPPDLDLSEFDDQPPLTRAELPGALEALREMTFSVPTAARMTELSRKHGMTQARLIFLTFKVLSGMSHLLNSGAVDDVMGDPAAFRLAVPNKAELKIIRGSLDKIVAFLSVPMDIDHSLPE